MLLAKCPNCGADLDERSFEYHLPNIDVDVTIEETDSYGPYVKVVADEWLDVQFSVSCLSCWWWWQEESTIQIDTNDKVSGEINERLRPMPKGPNYDDATEMWAQPKKRRGY